MADRFAAFAREFLTLHPAVCYRDEMGFERHVYKFLTDQHPSLSLTQDVVARVMWSIAMLRPGGDA
jgi:hypothetical protein